MCNRTKTTNFQFWKKLPRLLKIDLSKKKVFYEKMFISVKKKKKKKKISFTRRCTSAKCKLKNKQSNEKKEKKPVCQ